MNLSSLAPGAVLGAARSTAEWAVGTAVSTTAAAVAVPGRMLGLLDSAEAVVGRIEDVLRQVDGLVHRAGGVLTQAEAAVGEIRAITTSADAVIGDATRVSTAAAGLVGSASHVADSAAEVVASAGRTAHTANELVDAYAPLARQAQPLAARFVDELSPQEIDAAIALVDELPRLTSHLVDDVLPILATLDRVGPEIHQLLEVATDVRQAVLGIPGFNFLRRRGEDKEDSDAEQIGR
jgi:ABC-type transporter Mla subunit MlaD